MDQQTNGETDGSNQTPGEAFGKDVQSHIGRQLRAIYDGVVAQPIPDRFLELLEELERKAAEADPERIRSDPQGKP